MESKLKKRRGSSIPKLPDDTTQEIITTTPSLTIGNLDKSLPPLPLPSDNNEIDNSVSSLSSSLSTNQSSLSINNTPMKSDPVVSTTPTNVSSSDGFYSKNTLEVDQNDEDNLIDTELGDSNSVVGSFIKNITGYGGVSRSQSMHGNLDSKINITTHRKSSSINSNSDVINRDSVLHESNLELGNGIIFESENGTEMLSYRKSRSKANNRLSVETTSSNSKTHTKSRSISTPTTIENSRNELSSPQVSINSTFVNSLTPVVVPTPKLEVDYNLYVDEKYLDTQYRFAADKRNTEFHQVFTNIPEDDRLLDDFSCALSREILLQGRMYISEHYMCFNSSLLGWVTSLVLSLDEIEKFERRSTVGLFPNGIIIETKDSKHVFANFISRDQTLNFIETIWSKSISLSKQNHEKSRDFESLESKSSFENIYDKNMKVLSENDLYTIDGDSSSDEGSYKADNENYELDEDRTINGSQAKNVNTEGKPKNDVNNTIEKKKILGPRKHSACDYKIDYQSTQEKVVLNKVFNLPLGLLYEIFFGDDLTFHKNMMIMNDGFNFTDYSGFKKEGDERSFEYDKKLNYPIGPSSTRVYCTERLEHCDFDKYIEILNISKTPNVPSGTAFDCRTRYLLTWDEGNMTRLIISFKLEWTGSSWFKGVIESSALSGQQKAANDVDNELLKIIPQKIIEYNLYGDEEETKSVAENDKLKANVAQETEEPRVPMANLQPAQNQIDSQIIDIKQLSDISRLKLNTSFGSLNISWIIAVIFIILMFQVYMLVQLKNEVEILRTIIYKQIEQ